MKRRHKDIDLLLGILLVFSFSIGILYGKKNMYKNGRSGHESPVITIPDRMRLIQPFIRSHSVEKIAQSLKDVPITIALIITNRLIQNKQLTRDDKLHLLFAFLKNYDDQKSHFSLLEFVRKNKQLQKGEPLLVVAVRGDYASIIPIIVPWAEKMRAQVGDIVQQALMKTIQENDSEMLKTLVTQGVPVTTPVASELLWMSIENNNDPEFVDFLVLHGADLNMNKAGYTLLSKAAENANKALVMRLIAVFKKGNHDKKACIEYVNKIVDPSVGSALQIAIEKGSTDVELFLRSQEARE